MRGLAHIGGVQVLDDLAELIATVAQPFELVLARLERAKAWIHDPATELLLVTAVREDAIASAGALRAALSEVGLAPSAVLVNRTLPAPLRAEIDSRFANESTFAQYLRVRADIQANVIAAATHLAPGLVALPAVSGLDSGDRLDVLSDIGGRLCTGLS